MDLIAMSAAVERVKESMLRNPRKTFERICKDGECRMVETKRAFETWRESWLKERDIPPPPPPDGKKRVLILMSDTGGGHRASAQALDRSLQEQFPGKVNVTIMDIWTDHANTPFNNFVPVYRYLAKNPILWRGFYLYGLFPPTKMFTEIWSWQNSYKSFKRAIISNHPDLVVSVHPLCQLMPIWAIEEMNKNVREKSKFPVNFVTVVTDLGGAHKTWFDRRADKVFIPSMAVKKVALKNRIPESKIVMRGLPIRPAFWKQSKPKRALRKLLGLTDESKTVLVMGGGDGVGGLGKIVVDIADKLGKDKSMAGKKSQVVVICGNNKKLVHQLQDKKYPASVRVIVKGFVENVDEYMGASDCLVTKAGPGTIAEAMTRGLPMVISSFLPGQVCVCGFSPSFIVPPPLLPLPLPLPLPCPTYSLLSRASSNKSIVNANHHHHHHHHHHPS
jgi:1,2-diacylglycerol 3-beta-galactosyltransferase